MGLFVGTLKEPSSKQSPDQSPKFGSIHDY